MEQGEMFSYDADKVKATFDALAAQVVPPKKGPSSYITEQKPIGSKGSRNAKIVMVGEAPGKDEMQKGIPFVGASGHELDKLLVDAGIITMVKDERGNSVPDYSNVYFTNVTLIRPPDNKMEEWVQKASPKTGKAKRKKPGKNIKKPTPSYWVDYRSWLVEPHVAIDAQRLIDDIKQIKPNVVIALGHSSFWALCKEGIIGSITKWRGSTLWSDAAQVKVIPTFHPAFVLRAWENRRIVLRDLARARVAALTPDLSPVGWDFLLSPTYEACCGFLRGILDRLQQGPVKLCLDIEGAQQKLLCIGLATSSKRAVCIPLRYKGGFYYTMEQMFVICYMLYFILQHPNAFVIGQNIGHDTQFMVNELLIYPNIKWDTMIADNILWPGQPKNLAYMASIYCSQYRYWKDDSEEFWKVKRISNWEEIWFYNCEDCCRTFEIQEVQERTLAKRNLTKQFEFQQYEVAPLTRKLMFRGVRVDKVVKLDMFDELIQAMDNAQREVNYIAGEKLDISSPVQLKRYFYDKLKLPKQFKDKKGEAPSVSCDAEALVALTEIEPLTRPLVRRINLYRSYIAAKKVCRAGVDDDGRWRCSYSLGLVETLRLSSAENPYGRGLNLQNISAGKDIKDGE